MDDLKEKLGIWLQRLTLWLKALWGLILATFPYSAILIGVILLGIFIAYLTYHGTSKIEKQAEDARTETIKNDANTNVLSNQVDRNEGQVEQAEKTSENARKRAETARQKPKANVSIDEAIKNCEEVYGKGECG